ncbi:hypothetical protein E8E13_005131 [Curvularia kusanoi]|uniref:Uncharacterized protein n=1 Tax=Curvularia kusanoi TaxID=90978 RepID=A0A9P4WA04_CURKU|nr:hypothetical protein E8E13_005131 [Curvularia kusanoi]
MSLPRPAPPIPRNPQQIMSDVMTNAAIEQSNADSSPLLRLPGELRNKVYKYALSEYTFRGDIDDSAFGPHIVALLLACRQIHLEARFFVFELNNFVLNTSCNFGAPAPQVVMFERMSSEQLRRIRSIRLETMTYYPDRSELLDWHLSFLRRLDQSNLRIELVSDPLSMLWNVLSGEKPTSHSIDWVEWRVRFWLPGAEVLREKSLGFGSERLL